MIPILLYHSISDQPIRAMRPRTIPTTAFARHCRLLAASGRTPMTVSAFADGMRSASLPPDPVVVTFDGGFLDTLAAASRLAAEGLVATVFVTTSWLGRPGMLAEADLCRLADLGAEVGGHSHTHRRLDELGGPELAAELTVCRRSLTAATGTEVRSFAYPHGSHDQRTRRAVAAAGYNSACAASNTMSHPADDTYALARLVVTADVTDAHLTAWLEGRYNHPPRGGLLRNRVLGRVRRAQSGLRPGAASDQEGRGPGDATPPGPSWDAAAGRRPERPTRTTV